MKQELQTEPEAGDDYALTLALDFAVLEHVREQWDTAAQYRFATALVQNIWGARPGTPPALQYQPGDYGRAAKLAGKTESAA